MSRVLIWTAPRLVGEMAAEELREEGLPVTIRFSGLETEMYPSNFVEVWLEDEKLLEDFEVRQKIEDVIAAPPLDEKDAEKIAAMPLSDEPEKPLFRWKTPSLIVQFLLAFAAAIALLWIFMAELGPG